MNLKKWQELPPPYRAAFEAATVEANLYMLAEYDAKNPAALQRLLKQGVKLHAFPKDVMLAACKASFELYEEEARKNATFRRIYVEWKKFAAASDQWFKGSGIVVREFHALREVTSMKLLFALLSMTFLLSVGVLALGAIASIVAMFLVTL